MRQNPRQMFPRRSGPIGAMLVLAALVPIAAAGDYGYGRPYRHYYSYDPYWDLRLHDDQRTRQEIRGLNRKMQRQQRQIDEQVQEQREQTRLLRQQESAQSRATARQACFYRVDGALDLCDRLFELASEKHAGCVSTAKEMNPGCNLDIARPANPAEQ